MRARRGNLQRPAAQFRADGKNVMIAAADTFRAAAIDQLKTWAQRAGGVPVVAQSENSDPAAVVFDALAAAKDAGFMARGRKGMGEWVALLLERA